MFDEAKADRAVKFIRNLKHTKGEWAGHPFNLMPWEEKIIRDLFGTVREDGSRQYREAYISMGRKSGKTEFVASIANYMLFADGEQGGEVYTCAADRDQASLVFNASKTMVENNPTLYSNSKILDSVKRIVFDKKNSFYRAISSESYTKHGYNPSCVINDELHIWPNRDLYDVMKTGMGARHQPLIINITTAGFDRHSLCWEIYEYAKKIQKKPEDDPTFYTAIFELDEKDDWKDETNWYKANPGLGVYRSLDEMREAFNRATKLPAFQNTFKRLYLNMWTEQSIKAIDRDLWDSNVGDIRTENDLLGRKCYCGLDLASVSDFIAWVMIFPRDEDSDEIDVISRFWCPEKKANDIHNRYMNQYQVWAREGYLTLTPGNAIDYGFVKKTILEDAQKFNIADLNVDRLFQGQQLSGELLDEGLTVVGMGQGFLSMIAPCNEFERRLLMRKIHHGNNPVMNFCADNLMWKEGPAGHKPDRQNSQGKIDGIVSLIMAIESATRNMGTSVYDKPGRGILYLEPLEEKEEEPQEAETITVSAAICQRCGFHINGEFCDNCGTRKLTNETTLHA